MPPSGPQFQQQIPVAHPGYPPSGPTQQMAPVQPVQQATQYAPPPVPQPRQQADEWNLPVSKKTLITVAAILAAVLVGILVSELFFV
jgi:hypothetical protein